MDSGDQLATADHDFDHIFTYPKRHPEHIETQTSKLLISISFFVGFC